MLCNVPKEIRLSFLLENFIYDGNVETWNTYNCMLTYKIINTRVLYIISTNVGLVFCKKCELIGN